ncbi:hypothetical protein C7B79_11850 [Chroococcidiopsis cubana CCALA 043]|nr:P-loop NTPase [Chroococcidiopsis cubana]PSB63949.1 hypothetical protein C7B79_11850 [Chroococcidiopsis cubana CCALA 043]
MSYLRDRFGEAIPIFGSGGGKQLAAELHTPLLGQVPIDPQICTGGDAGKPLTLADSISLTSRTFQQIAAALNATFCPVLVPLSSHL